MGPRGVVVQNREGIPEKPKGVLPERLRWGPQPSAVTDRLSGFKPEALSPIHSDVSCGVRRDYQRQTGF